MSLLSGILQSQVPAKQDATTAIQTLCLRLTTSNLVEDRRAAILSLRSFAREYKEIVASGGLRGLIQTLAKDYEDADTAKVVLETLLLLFVKDETNPESSDDIALWLADEFTQKQENLTILIDLVENPDFYTRLYTLQLLSAILEHRPERTQESVFNSPLGIFRLASILEDKRDAIRNEVILLLVRLSDGHHDVQKIVAFENAFDRVFNIIDVEGGIDGGIVVQDCLRLLTNLLSYNASNQVLFRETGFIQKLAQLFNMEDAIPHYALGRRNDNLNLALGVCRAFVARGGNGTPANQQALFHSGVLSQVLHLAFSNKSDFSVRAEALRVCAAIIHGNSPLQQNFAQLQTPYMYISGTLTDSPGPQNGDNKFYIIEGLLDQALLNSAIQAFDARIAACTCLESYFSGNTLIRLHFLSRALEGYTSGEDETPNFLACLMELDSESRNDPYRIWIAAVIFLHIIYDNEEAKVMATSMKFGDEGEGEEVVTVIQTLAANLITCLEHNYDPRISLAYLMVLSIWLYEDTTAVDDFLEEGVIVQSLVAAVTKSAGSNFLIQGLCTFLLGILYEFSTTKSPVPRATLHTILVGRLGRDQYVNKLTRLRENSIVRDFEVTDQTHTRKRGLPDIYFNHLFIDFLKDNYNRIFRTIEKDPGTKTHYKLGSDGTPNGISLELVDSLKAQITDKDGSIGRLQTLNMELEKKLAQEQQELKKFKEGSTAEIRKYHDQADAMKNVYETNAAQAEGQLRATVLRLENRVARVQQEGEGQIRKLEVELLKTRKEAEDNVKRQKVQGGLEVKRTKDAWDADIQKLRHQYESEMTKLEENYRREIARVKTEGDSLVVQITTQSRAELQRTQAEGEDELRRWRDRTAEDLRNLQEQHDAELRLCKEQQGAQINLLKERINHLEVELAASVSELQSTGTRYENELAEVRKSIEADATQKLELQRAWEERLLVVQLEAETRVKAISENHSHAEERATALEGKLKATVNQLISVEQLLERAMSGEKDSGDEEGSAQEDWKEGVNTDTSSRAFNEPHVTTDARLLSETAVIVCKVIKKLSEAEEKVSTAEEKARNVQIELEDLLLVLGDIEDKKKAYKRRLKSLREEVSEEEDGSGDGDGGESNEQGEDE